MSKVLLGIVLFSSVICFAPKGQVQSIQNKNAFMSLHGSDFGKICKINNIKVLSGLSAKDMVYELRQVLLKNSSYDLSQAVLEVQQNKNKIIVSKTAVDIVYRNDGSVKKTIRSKW